MKKYFLGTGAAMALPALALAQQFTQASNLNQVWDNIQSGFKIALIAIISVAVIYFIYSLLQYLGGGDKGEARSHMLWGIIIIAVMVSVWGLVSILTTSLVSNQNVAPPVPALPQQ